MKKNDMSFKIVFEFMSFQTCSYLPHGTIFSFLLNYETNLDLDFM